MSYIGEGPRIQLLFPALCCQPTDSPWDSGTPACSPREPAWMGVGGPVPPGTSLLAFEASQWGQGICMGLELLLGVECWLQTNVIINLCF